MSSNRHGVNLTQMNFCVVGLQSLVGDLHEAALAGAPIAGHEHG